ncbi:MAG: prepilin-type N-terminal cleavage/methylation domain-containing protein [Anaerotignum sp.]|nr:prepilin-type N-terminal cleavage/methylation domain-containing protein [Anaerotignum sp.]
MKLLKTKKGFTLMEMLIVIAIIAILVAIAIPTFSGALKKAKYTADVANVRAWYAEEQIKEMNNPTTNTLATTYSDTKIQLTGAHAYVAGTSAEDFKITYYSGDNTNYPDVTFPAEAAAVPKP